MPVNIKSGESEEQFISRCIGEEVSAGEANEVETQQTNYTPEFEAWYKSKGSPLKSKEDNLNYYLKCIKK